MTAADLSLKNGLTKNVKKSDEPKRESKKNSKRPPEFSSIAPKIQNK